MSVLTRTVWILSLVSLFMDLASEMLYPVVPVYLKAIGFSFFWIGLLEGIAELIVGISKGYFGYESDRTGKKLPFVRLGYLLSAISKPLMALAPFISGIFTARTLDRLGKGVRTSARDALLAQEASPATKARVFNFHRGWDTVGATLGPVLALTLLHFYPGAYRTLFLIAFVPGLISVALLFLLKEQPATPSVSHRKGFFQYLGYFQKAPGSYKALLIGLLIFALANSSDVFLLLKAKEVSGSDSIMISAYIFYNLIYAISAYPMGILADRFGLKKVLLFGFVLFILVYLGFAWIQHTVWVYVCFAFYGIYAAATEGIAKAWISNVVPSAELGTALGFFASGQSIAALCASVVAGLMWDFWGSQPVFLTAAVIAAWAALFIARIKNTVPQS